MYNSKFSFYKYHDTNNFSSLSFVSKYSYLFNFKYELDNFNKLEPQKKKKRKQVDVYHKASKLCNEFLGICLGE